jgi:hypothetical protein
MIRIGQRAPIGLIVLAQEPSHARTTHMVVHPKRHAKLLKEIFKFEFGKLGPKAILDSWDYVFFPMFQHFEIVVLRVPSR